MLRLIVAQYVSRSLSSTELGSLKETQPPEVVVGTDDDVSFASSTGRIRLSEDGAVPGMDNPPTEAFNVLIHGF